jgi:hypothetical protein
MAATALKRKPISSKPLAVVTNPFNAKTEIPEQGKFFLIYGEPGEGKTTLAAQFPKPIFITTHGETGIDSAKRVNVADKDIPVVRLTELYPSDEIPAGTGHEGFTECIDTLNIMAQGNHDRRTIVIDTLSGMEKIAEQHCASLEFNGDMFGRGQDEWNAWACGPRRMCDGYWLASFIPACLRCVEAGYNVVLLGHCKTATIKHPSVPDYQKYQPDLTDRIFNATSKSLQYILFLGRQPEFTEDKKTKKRTVAASNRFVGVARDTWYEAKNWDDLQDPIFCGLSAKDTYTNLTESIVIV